ncbi:MAG: DUF488 family protein, partial [Candidatus Binataceae bacterium]
MASNTQDSARPIVFTIGHSNHPLERFLELLAMHEIAVLADVRSFPGSRKWPHFGREMLLERLARAEVEYHWTPELGGRRKSERALSRHTAWTVAAFRAYADYTETTEFETGLEGLTSLARSKRTAYMCSEGLWWQCHRRLISDVLLVRGWDVRHILPDGKIALHALPK